MTASAHSQARPPGPNAYQRFCAELDTGLRSYARRLAESRADLIVAISRKSPRLLQLVAELAGMPQVELGRCVSEKALPFIPRESLRGSAVTLTDDTIVYGSTFAGVWDSLRDAGAIVSGEVLAVARDANPLIAQLVSDHALVLDEARIQHLIDLEIQAFGALAVPYDIDHPILTIPFKGDEGDLVDRLERRHPGTWRPTNPWHEAHGVTVLSLPVPEAVGGMHSQRGRRLGPYKLRLFVDSERQATRAVAIMALALREDDLVDPDLFAAAPGPLSQLWASLVDRATAANWSARDRHRALANGAHYLAGCEALWLWLVSGGLGIDSRSATLSEFDLRLLFGPDGAAALHRPLENHLSTASAQAAPAPGTFPPPADEQFDAAAELASLESSESGRRFLDNARRYLALAAPYDPSDLIQSLFSAQRRVYDEQTRDAGPADPGRLSAGLIPFPLVASILRELGAEVADGDFERFADQAIDGGSVVPHYHPSASQPDLWVRSVRAGERGTQKLKHWLYSCVVEAEHVYERLHRVPNKLRGQGVPWYVCEKLFAVLAAGIGPNLRPELGKRVDCGRDEFGARAVATDIPRSPYLLDWAVHCGFVERVSGRTVRRNGRPVRGRMIRPNAEFRELYPAALDTIDPLLRSASRTVVEGFLALDALFEGERRDVAVLAVSSCGTYDAYTESLSAALEVWLYSRRFNPLRLAGQLLRLASDPQRDLASRAAFDLREGATALVQTDLKERSWTNRLSVRDAVDQACETADLMAPHTPAWEEHMRPLITDEDPPDRHCERYLLHGARLANEAVSVARSVMSDHGLAPKPEDDNHTAERHARDYNGLIDLAKQENLHYHYPPLADVEALSSPDPPSALRSVVRLLRDTQAAVEEIWGTWRRPETEETVAVFENDRVVLMWDIRDSSADPDAVQPVIHRVNERLLEDLPSRGYGVFINDQDDGNLVVLPSVGDAVEVFLIIAEIFADSRLSLRAGIETTLGGHELRRNQLTGYFSGKTVTLAARTMTAFEETASGKAPCDGYLTTDGELKPKPEAPGGSYVLITARAVQQLREEEELEQPPGCEYVGTIVAYKARAGPTLSTDVSCYVP